MLAKTNPLFHLVFSTHFAAFRNPDETFFLVFDILFITGMKILKDCCWIQLFQKKLKNEITFVYHQESFIVQSCYVFFF